MKESIVTFAEKIIDAYRERKPINLKKLEKVLILLDKMYDDGGTTPLSDFQYDTLFEIYTDLTGNIISSGETTKQKAIHDYPLLKGTIRKVHYISNSEKVGDTNSVASHKVLYDWINMTYKKLNSEFTGRAWKLGFWPKFDGASIILSLDENRICTKAITRGQEDIGLDKTRVFSDLKFNGMIPEIYDGTKVGLKSEVILTKSNYKDYNEKYADNQFSDARSALVSIINSEVLTSFHLKYLTVKPLMYCVNDILKSYQDGDEFGPTITLSVEPNEFISEEKLKETIKKMKEYIETLDVNCDGIVIRWFEDDAIKTLGRDVKNYVNKFEIAYKFPADSNYTILRDIKQDIGILGEVSFTAIFDPIMIQGKKVKHASLCSEYRMKELNLSKGDMVNIKYEIIPYLTLDATCLKNKSNEPPIPIATHCPYCNSELVRNPELMCINTECPARIQGKLFVFINRLGITGIKDGFIENLFKNGIVTKIEDLFDLESRKQAFITTDGLGKRIYKSLLNQINNLNVEEYKILASAAIPSLALKRSKLITDKYYITELIDMAINDKEKLIDELSKMDNMSNKRATIIANGISENVDILRFLLSKIKIKKKKKHDKGCIVFTGFRNQEFSNYLEDIGYEITTTVNKHTKYVVAVDPDPINPSDKLKKARILEVPIISIPEAYELFGFKK